MVFPDLSTVLQAGIIMFSSVVSAFCVWLYGYCFVLYFSLWLIGDIVFMQDIAFWHADCTTDTCNFVI